MVTQVVGAKTQWTAMTCSFDVKFLSRYSSSRDVGGRSVVFDVELGC